MYPIAALYKKFLGIRRDPSPCFAFAEETCVFARIDPYHNDISSGSRRPASWRNPNITISKEEAISELSQLRSIIASEPDFESMKEKFMSLAQEESDCSRYSALILFEM